MPAGTEELAVAVARLRAGHAVAFPTETVYGLGADAFNEQAVARVFALKGRPAGNPLIVHVADEAMAQRVTGGGGWPPEAFLLAAAFWPGPLTILLPRSPLIPAIVTAGSPFVGVRCPDHRLTLSLLAAFGGPLVGPSANPSGRVSPTRPEHVAESFTPDEVFVLDGGPCPGGIESTVLSLEPHGPTILRPGPVPAAMIAETLGRPVTIVTTPAAAPDQPHHSPGLLPRHYAPRTPAVLFTPAELPALLAHGSASGPVAVITHTPRAVPPPHQIIPMPADAPGYAARLYAALREA
ncbi:MAG: L-threonylcarbamoyladenylate synthase, partial [Dehalococcoidia bacterium]